MLSMYSFVVAYGLQNSRHMDDGAAAVPEKRSHISRVTLPGPHDDYGLHQLCAPLRLQTGCTPDWHRFDDTLISVWSCWRGMCCERCWLKLPRAGKHSWSIGPLLKWCGRQCGMFGKRPHRQPDVGYMQRGPLPGCRSSTPRLVCAQCSIPGMVLRW